MLRDGVTLDQFIVMSTDTGPANNLLFPGSFFLKGEALRVKIIKEDSSGNDYFCQKVVVHKKREGIDQKIKNRLAQHPADN